MSAVYPIINGNTVGAAADQIRPDSTYEWRK